MSAEHRHTGVFETEESPRLIVLQFQLPDKEKHLELVKWLAEEGLERLSEKEKREQRQGTGRVELESTPAVEAASFLEDLEYLSANYDLVDAFCQRRHRPKKPGFTYLAVRYIFAKTSSAKSFPNKGEVIEELRQILRSSIWSCLVYRNPYFEKGEAVPGAYSLSINLAGRIPKRNVNGKPNMMWIEKNGAKQKLQANPIYSLRFAGNSSVQLEPAQGRQS